MNHILITQSRNESYRLKNWIAYHASQGITDIIFYDDHSTDTTELIIKKLCDLYHINLFYQKTDNLGDFFNTTNSNAYGHSSSLNKRIIRSLSSGIKKAKSLYKTSVCYCIDVDEYIVSNIDDKISKIIENLFTKLNIERIYCHSFECLHNPDNSEYVTKQDISSYRWDFNSRSNSIFKGRGKSIILSNFINNDIPQIPNAVHDLGCYIKRSEDYRNFENLRIHHFRNPPLFDPNYDISFIQDYTLINKSKNI